MNPGPLILVVGEDALTERVRAELTSTVGHEVRVVWPIAADSDDDLLEAGVEDATSILTLSSDDGLNLAVALRARMLNRRIRVVLRQFNELLGAKVEQNLPDCTALSPAAHSAATYAAAALDQNCFFALRFPQADGQLLGFTQAPAAAYGAAGWTVRETEERLSVRVLALGEHLDPPADALVGKADRMVAFGPIVERRTPRPAPERAPAQSAAAERPARWAWQRLDKVLRTLIVAAIVFFIFSFAFFHFALHKSWAAASFDVAETMTNVGFGDESVTRNGLITIGAIVAMIGGIIFTSVFIGYVSSALTRAQWFSIQGLRRIRARSHVVVCGGGNLGNAVIGLLAEAGKRIVVIEPNPDAGLVRRARDGEIDLLTGDANRDDALALCDISNASAVLALTGNDATNLEIALGARARGPAVPLVVRVENDAFARATSAVFGFSTFSPAALAAPAFAGLARFPGTRGRVRFAGEDHTIGQRHQGEVPERPPAELCTPLCVRRDGKVLFIREFTDMKPFDELLFIVPLGQFRRTQPA